MKTDLDSPEEHGGEGDVIWAVVYGDFMSYLMVFFMVLFAFSMNSPQATGDPAAPTVEDSLAGIQKEFGGTISRERLERLTRKETEDQASVKLQKMIKDQGLEGVAKVETNDKWVKLVLTSPVLFAPGSAEINAATSSVLHSMTDILGKMQGEIVVEGHTDDVPISGGEFKSNWDLSGARANAVVRLFVQWGLAPQRMTATGYGEYRPKVPNDSPEHRALNRRIEIGLRRS
jgi:chemotaxis protein MotB